jgi:hypothetical protein
MPIRRSIVLFGVSILAGCGGGEAQPRSTFVLGVRASQSALDSFVLSAEGLDPDPKLHFAANLLLKTFYTTAPLTTVEGQPFTLRSSSSAGAEVSALVVTPFVCASDPTFAAKVEAGWQGAETLEVYLQPDGALTAENEFDRQLAHRCEWVAPGASDGEGSSTPNRSPSLCSEGDRLGTMLDVLDVSDPSAEQPLTMTTCGAYHYNYTAPPDVDGVIVDQVTFAKPGEEFAPTLILSHCWRASEPFPAVVAVDDARASSCTKEASAIEMGAGSTLRQVLASAGSWTIANGPGLPGGGHQLADVDLTFGTPGTGAPAFKVRGHIDLPIVKVDVQ